MAKNAKMKIAIGDLSGRARPVEPDAVIVVVPRAIRCTDTYRTAEPTVITNGGTQRDRGIELDCRRSRGTRSSMSKRKRV